VSFLFEKKGSIQFDRESVSDDDALLEAALEAGAEDVEEGETSIEVLTSPSEFEAVREALVKTGFEPAAAEIALVPSTTVELAGDAAAGMLKLAEDLEDLDDVQNFYANFDISEDELARLA
jgi:transcriptional/translational regulatory protein YebC/TACO1